MFKPIYKKQSHGQKSQANAYTNGKKHALKVAPEVENSCQIGFANKVIMFKETLKFKQIILLCYGKQKTPILK
jgi:hypothetical protein